MIQTLRKDAAAHRERLLRVARELFATRGVDVTLNDIAHHAGVGWPRPTAASPTSRSSWPPCSRTPSRSSRASPAALAEPDAWVGPVGFLERSLDLQFGDAGLNAIMSHPALADDQVGQAQTRIAPLLDELVAKAKQQGAIRPDLEQSDIVFLQAGLASIRNRSAGIEPGLYSRYLTLVLDGIRPGWAVTACPSRL